LEATEREKNRVGGAQCEERERKRKQLRERWRKLKEK
jgi:hypothetical protein